MNNDIEDIEHISHAIGVYLTEIVDGYILSLQDTQSLGKPWFSLSVVRSLSLHFEIFCYVDPKIREKFIFSLESSFAQYVSLLKQESIHTDIIIKIELAIAKLIHTLKQNIQIYKPIDTNHIEQKLILQIITGLMQKCELLFVSINYNQEALDLIQAYAIALNLQGIDLAQKIELIPHLISVKELWVIDSSKVLQDTKVLFFLNPFQHLSKINVSSVLDAFEKIVLFFVEQNCILEHLSDQELISLYEKLQSVSIRSKYLLSLFEKIHAESYVRYSYNKASNTSYELLKLFQTLDSVITQIEEMKYEVVCAYLSDSVNFVLNLWNILKARIALIQSLNMQPTVQMLFAQSATSVPNIDQTLSVSNSSLFESHKNEISALGMILVTNLFEAFTKDLSFFIAASTSESLMHENEIKLFCNASVAKKIALIYHKPIASDSELRILNKERPEIISALSYIDFVSLFKLHKKGDNVRLLLKTLSENVGLRNCTSSKSYIEGIFGVIVSYCSVFQLHGLYKRIVLGNLDKVQLSLLYALKSEIKRRSALLYRLFLVVTFSFDDLKILDQMRKLEYIND